MIGTFRSLGSTCPRLAALLIVCLAPAAAPAQSLRFHNDTKGAVLLQTACVDRGIFRQGPRFQLLPDRETPAILLPGNKIITISDPRMPTRVLYQGTIPASLEEQRYSIVPDMPVPRVKLELERPATRP